MIKNNRILFFVILLCFIFAEEPLTLEKTFSLALEKSPKAKLIKNQYEIDKSKALQGYGPVLPNLEYKYSDMGRKTPETEEIQGFSQSNETTVKTTELSASQLLFSFSGYAAWMAAGAAGKIADYIYADSKESFLLEVRKAYYDLQIATAVKNISFKAYEQASAHAREARLMMENGLINKKDYLDARVQELSAKQGLFNAQKNHQVALGSFNILIGRDKDNPVELATHNIQAADRLKELNTAELTEYSLANKPSWKAFRETVILSEADNFNAIGESLPGVYYIYSKQHNKYKKESIFTPNGDTETQGISVGWKFFSGGANLFKIQEKHNYKELMRRQEEILCERQKIEISNALLDYRQKADNYLAAQEKVALARESFKIAEINFQSGNLTDTLYQDSLTQLTAAEIELVKAGFDYEYAGEYLNYSTGKKVI